jgi:hypothetical protein
MLPIGRPPEYANAIMASSPGLSFFDHVLKKALPGSAKYKDVLKATGPVFLTVQINAYNKTAGNSIVKLPMERFYG